MHILASDTSSSHGSVAVRNSSGEVVLVEMVSDRPHSETLLPAVSEALSLAGLERRDIQALAVGIGPGAFTGLRVGLATFKAWASAAGLPVLPVSSLDAVAFPVLMEKRGAIVIADARKAEAYTCYYRSLDAYGLPQRHAVPELVQLGKIPAWVESIDDRTAIILGTGVSLIEETASCIERNDDYKSYLPYPSASHVLAIGEIMASAGRIKGPASLVPDYVRPPDARPAGRSIRPGVQ